MRHSFHCPFGCCSGGMPRLLGCGVCAPSSLHAPYRADALSSQVVSILTSYSYAKSPNLKSGQNQEKKKKEKEIKSFPL